MASYIARRLLQLVPVLLLASIVIFGLMRLIPGDPAQVLAGEDASPERIQEVRVRLGLDQPLPMQYVVWLGRVLQGDLGESVISGQSVATILSQKLPATAELAVGALLLALVVGIPLGVTAALRRGSGLDLAVTAYTSIVLGIPNFWLGLLLIIVFVVMLNWLPPGGRVPFTENPLEAIKYLLMPVLTLSIRASGIFIRFTRTAMLEVLPEDYVRTARAKGLTESAVVLRHALRCALIPVVTIVGLEFGRLLAGAVIAEQIFAWPGVGRLIIQSVGQRDYAIVQGVLLLLVAVFVLINLLTDLMYGFLDPRIRLARGR
ncbi:MAG: ABC transporter permease [Chloroflexi bacterium]|nr:ABC transporter permease [Chloroflexota bacterium]